MPGHGEPYRLGCPALYAEDADRWPIITTLVACGLVGASLVLIHLGKAIDAAESMIARWDVLASLIPADLRAWRTREVLLLRAYLDETVIPVLSR